MLRGFQKPRMSLPLEQRRPGTGKDQVAVQAEKGKPELPQAAEEPGTLRKLRARLELQASCWAGGVAEEFQGHGKGPGNDGRAP